jgi:DNA primase
MAMHLAGVPTAVASCGTAFGAEHIAVIRRLIGDDSFDLGEVIYTFDGDAAGQAAALKAFEGEQTFATQTFVTIAPGGQDPCELRQAAGDTAVRDLVARREPIYEFAIRSILRDFDLDRAEGRVAALQRTVPLVAQIKREDLRDEYARRLAGWTSWDDIAMVVRRVRETAGAPVEPRANGSRRRDPVAAPRKDDPRLHRQREALKAALQLPAIAGPEYDELPEHSFTHPAFAAVHEAVQKAGGVCSGLGGAAWLEAVQAQCRLESRSLVTELAVEPLELSQATSRSRDATDAARYVSSIIAGLRLVLVEAQVAELKARLQRTNGVEDPDGYMQIFGDLVPLEQYQRALREKAYAQ